jgi:Rab GDP dissociation inhibitor
VKEGEEPWKKYGRSNSWNVDLVPKLLMSNGELTNILVSTDVTRYLEFRQIAGSYVQQGNGPKATVAKVPSDAGEALRSSLMGLFEKRRAKKFLEWVGEFDEENPSTHLGKPFVDGLVVYPSQVLTSFLGTRIEPLHLHYAGRV